MTFASPAYGAKNKVLEIGQRPESVTKGFGGKYYITVMNSPDQEGDGVIKVLDAGRRRGPAAEAQYLYDDLEPPKLIAHNAGKPSPAATSAGCREPGAGRPTKADRRAIDRLRAWIGLSRQ